MNEIVIPLIIDLMTLTVCIAALLKLGRISAMHPATTYLFFHVWVVTKRLVEIALGSPLSAFFRHQPITITELTRASLMFDLVLFLMTTAFIITSTLDFKRNGPLPAFGHEKAPNLSKSYIVNFAWLMIPFGIYGMFKGHSEGAAAGDWDNSFATTMIQSWLPLSMMLFFYWYGPRKPIIAAGLVVLGLLVMFMGHIRWLMLLPTIFCCFVYLSRNGLWWPPRKVVIILAVAGALWLPGKQISSVIAQGGNISDIAQVVAGVWTTSTTQSDSPDTQFLDMAAMTVSLVDEHGKFFYGGTILPAFYNFIPRPLWPDKPLPTQWMADISTPDRPMASYTMTPALMGAAYVDFGYVGIVLLPFLFALFLGWAYFQAFRCSHYSVGRFYYLVIACTLFQPFRDGLYTFFIFNCIYLMPLAFVALLHLVFPTRKLQGRSRYPTPVRLDPATRVIPANPSRRGF